MSGQPLDTPDRLSAPLELAGTVLLPQARISKYHGNPCKITNLKIFSRFFVFFHFPKNVSGGRPGYQGMRARAETAPGVLLASAAPPSGGCKWCGGVCARRRGSGLSHAECDKSGKIRKIT